MTRATLSAVFGVVAVAFCASGDARADISVYAIGSAACVKGGANGEAYYPWAGLYNNSTTQEMFVECSVPYTFNTSSGGGKDTRVRLVNLNVDDRSTALNISCDMRLMSLGGDIVESGGALTTSGTGEKPLTWFVNSNFTFPYASCTLPRTVGSSRSGVQGMQVDYKNF